VKVKERTDCVLLAVIAVSWFGLSKEAAEEA